MQAKMGAYLARCYIWNFLFLGMGLLAIVYLFDTVELLRRADGYDDVPLSRILQMGLFKLPEVGQIIFPFIVLFSGLFTLWQLSRRYELIAIKAAGLSVWSMLAPFLLTAFCIGLFQVMVINPFGALLVSKYEALEGQYLKRQSNLVSFTEKGLWLKQDHQDGHAILHANTITMPDWTLKDVIVLFFDGDKSFTRRLDAKEASLEEGIWSFQTVVSNMPQQSPARSDYLTLATELTRQDIEDSFASPETISFWALPSYINVVEKAGFDAVRLKLHFHYLLSQPLLFMAMILLAASVSLRPPRSTNAFMLIAGGIFIGFFIFFASSFLQALGTSGQIPVLLAAWAGPCVAFLLGLTIIMNLEDG